MTVYAIIQIKNTCALALSTAAGQTDEDDKYDTIRNAYATVRTLQEGAEETDYSETPRAAMEEYLTESEDNVSKMIAQMETATSAIEVIPDPLPDGIVFIPTGGSGSGSGSGS